MINNVMPLTQSLGLADAAAIVNAGLGLAHLGRDDAVVGVTLRDVGLSSRRRFFMPDVYGPTVHPVLLPHTLMRERYALRKDGERQRKRENTELNQSL